MEIKMASEVANNLNMVIITKNPLKNFTLKWSIQNVSKIPGVVRCKKFAMATGYTKDWYATVSISSNLQIKASLTYDSQNDTRVRIEHDIKVFNSKGISLVRLSEKSHIYKSGDLFELFDKVNASSLPEDKVTLLVSMEVYGYGLETDCAVYSEDEDLNQGILQLQYDYRKMLENGAHSDLKIQIQKRIFSVHRSVLLSRAPEFVQAHLSGVLSEHEHILLHTIDTEVFESFLLYVYTGAVNKLMLENDAFKLYSVADKYNLMGLQKICAKSIVCELSYDSVFKVYRLAEQHKDGELIRQCELFMKANMAKLKDTRDWKILLNRRPDLEEDLLNLPL